MWPIFIRLNSSCPFQDLIFTVNWPLTLSNLKTHLETPTTTPLLFLPFTSFFFISFPLFFWQSKDQYNLKSPKKKKCCIKYIEVYKWIPKQKTKKPSSYLKPNQLTKSIINKDLILRPRLVCYKKLHKNENFSSWYDNSIFSRTIIFLPF